MKREKKREKVKGGPPGYPVPGHRVGFIVKWEKG